MASLKVITGQSEGAMAKLVKALKPLGDRVLVKHLGLQTSNGTEQADEAKLAQTRGKFACLCGRGGAR